jgi:drug/metabolite transporter (DMT)-like permease
MSDRLSLAQIVALVAYAGAMAGGQLLFKMAALRAVHEGPFIERAMSVLLNGYFLVALVLYAALAGLWVWILTFTPLSRAYPFVALAFAITPLLAGFVFGEAVTTRLMLGIGFILCGLLLVAG